MVSHCLSKLNPCIHGQHAFRLHSSSVPSFDLSPPTRTWYCMIKQSHINERVFQAPLTHTNSADRTDRARTLFIHTLVETYYFPPVFSFPPLYAKVAPHGDGGTRRRARRAEKIRQDVGGLRTKSSQVFEFDERRQGGRLIRSFLPSLID